MSMDMGKKFGSLPFSDEYIAEETVGHWAIEKDPDKEPRMYVDDVMLGLIGLEEQRTPEEHFKAWLAGIDENYLDSVMETERLNINGIHAEVQYPWHYPDGHTIFIRCEGLRNYAYEGGIRTEGRHRNVTNLVHLQKEEAVISALSGDFECVNYIILRENSDNDQLIPFRTSEKLKSIIPGWEDERSFHNRLELLIHYVGLPEDVKNFRQQTRRHVILEHLKHEPAYYVNARASVLGNVQYFQLKFLADRDSDGKLIGLVVGIHSIDDEMRQEMATRERIQKRVDEKTLELQQKNEELAKVNSRIIEMVGNIVESRDEESGNHINRVKYYTRCLALQVMKDMPQYGLSIEDVSAISDLSPLHDVGKIKIPDSILLKPGKLTDEEFAIMKSHSERGYEIVQGMADGWSPEYVKYSQDICRYHHEKWDGKGYPCGLKGNEIPIAAQIVSIADVYDALVSERCYKTAYTHDEAYRMILAGECGQFSEGLLSCFRKCRDVFRANAESIADSMLNKEPNPIQRVSSKEYISEAIPFLEKISESLPGGFFIYQADEEAKFLYFNNMMVQYLGCESREEFIEYTGNSFSGIVHPDDYANIQGDITKQIQIDNLDHVVYRTIRKDGSIRWLDDYGKLISSEDLGNVFFVFVNDFTDAYVREDDGTPRKKYSEEYPETVLSGALNGLRVLVVDDTQMTREIQRDLLEEEGAIVFTASNGLEAVNCIRDSMNYDLILMDLVMPIMSGVDAVREINKLLQQADCHIPVICLTAGGADQQVREAMEAGAYACIFKPLSIPELSRLVISAIKEKSAILELQLEEARKIAKTDALTQVQNLTAMKEKTAALALKLKENPDYNFGVIMCDCDDLKNVNDCFGHDVGDRYLCNTSAHIGGIFRNSPVYRSGGDEFSVILEGSDLENAAELFTLLLNKPKGNINANDIEAGYTDFSAGMAIYDRKTDRSVENVIKRADVELYKNKVSRDRFYSH